MASSERKRRALSWLSKNNIVAVVISGLFAVFAPQFVGLGGVVATTAENVTDQRVQEHCDKHGGCE